MSNDFKPFPFVGSFCKWGVDESKPLDEQIEEWITLLDVQCDIQEVGRSDSGAIINASFAVYFEFDRNVSLNISRGNTFKGNMYGIEVTGEVIGLFPTQLSGCTAYIKSVEF